MLLLKEGKRKKERKLSKPNHERASKYNNKNAHYNSYFCLLLIPWLTRKRYTLAKQNKTKKK